MITGTADHLEVRRPSEPSAPSASAAHVGAAGHCNAHVGVVVGRGDVDVGAVGHGNAGVGAVGHGNAGVGAVSHGNAGVDAVSHGNAGVGAVGHRSAHVGAPGKLDAAIVRTQAKEALVGLGWKPAIANPAVAAAAAALDAEATLDRLIFEALRRCSRSGA